MCTFVYELTKKQCIMKKGNAKKLGLNKIQIAALSNSHLQAINGGGDDVSWIFTDCDHGMGTDKSKGKVCVIDVIDDVNYQ